MKREKQQGDDSSEYQYLQASPGIATMERFGYLRGAFIRNELDVRLYRQHAMVKLAQFTALSLRYGKYVALGKLCSFIRIVYGGQNSVSISAVDNAFQLATALKTRLLADLQQLLNWPVTPVQPYGIVGFVFHPYSNLSSGVLRRDVAWKSAVGFRALIFKQGIVHERNIQWGFCLRKLMIESQSVLCISTAKHINGDLLVVHGIVSSTRIVRYICPV